MAAGSVALSGGAVAKNIVWVCASAVTMSSNVTFQGVILGKTSATWETGSSLVGQIYAQTNVALQKATISHS